MCCDALLPLSSLRRDLASRLCHRAFPDQATWQSYLCSFGIHFSLLCESDQWVFCGMVTPEARLAWCDVVVVFETFLIVLSTSFPMHHVSDIGL